MSDKKELIKEFILKYPNESGNWIYKESKKAGLGIRKQDFYGIVRKVRHLSEPTIEKKEKSIPIRYRVKPITPKVVIKPIRIPYEKTKFGKMAKTFQKKHNISEQDAIEHTRKMLKISKKDYRKLKQLDYDILTHYGY